MAGIYIHIPYCRAKCYYCDFFSTPRTDTVAATLDGIVAEYACRRQELASHPVSTVYFGGGTPSSLPSSALARICDAIPMGGACERTIEVNPDDVTAKNAGEWLGMGFNRVSMGIQSLNDDELRSVGRRHSAAEAITALSTLRDAGFDNISADLIYGLPGQTPASWETSLRRLLDTGITHLSAYSLSYEPGTRLTAMLAAGRITPVDDDTVAQMYHILCRIASDAGFEHYEISNFARPEMRSRHNSAYWTSTPYLGLGPGAHSLAADGTRRASPANIARWLRDGAQIDAETDVDRLNDRIITGLRTSDGLDLSTFHPDEAEALLGRAARFLRSGKLEYAGGVLSIPEKHWIVSDGIMCELLA
ncbi:MAG: radical SAM family heme chaperone HemW [Muribaculaceae bacterium]|mgnify:CR=1 FL=1|nr:radical SAM family heme chaperone HemW [Muribaculaceae bacterium]